METNLKVWHNQWLIIHDNHYKISSITTISDIQCYPSGPSMYVGFHIVADGVKVNFSNYAPFIDTFWSRRPDNGLIQKHKDYLIQQRQKIIDLVRSI